jgi:hypothetical protein
VQKAAGGLPRGGYAHGHVASGDDSDEKIIKRRNEMIKEFQINLTTGSVTGQKTLALLQTGKNAGDDDVNCGAEAASSAPSLVTGGLRRDREATRSTVAARTIS